MKAWGKQIKEGKATAEEPPAAIAVRLSAKTGAAGGSSSGGRGGGWRAHGPGAYSQSGADDFGYHPPYSQFNYPPQGPPPAYYMTVGAQSNPFQVPIQAAQQPPVTPTPEATTQAIPVAPPTSPINSDSDSEERLREFFDWVRRRPNWATPKLVTELETILNTLINNFYNLEALRVGISEQTWVDKLGLAAGLLLRLRRKLKTFRANQKGQ